MCLVLFARVHYIPVPLRSESPAGRDSTLDFAGLFGFGDEVRTMLPVSVGIRGSMC